MDAQQAQRDPDVITYSGFDGLRGDVSPERFGLTDLAVATNVDIDKSGRIARRQGYAQRVGGGAHSLWADETQEVCLFVSQGQLWRLFPDYSLLALRVMADPDARVAFTRVGDRIYFTNGRDTGIYELGAVRSWGLPQAPLPGAAVGAGNLPQGTYQFAMTWLRADGQESGCGLSGAIDVPASGAITFTFPTTTPAGVVGRVLYLSAPNSEVLYEIGQPPLSAATTTVLAPSPGSAYELRTQFCGPAPAGQLLAYYRGHMFVAVGDMLQVSQTYNYELFNPSRTIQLDGRITLLAPLMDKELTERGNSSGFFIGTERSVGIIAGSDPDHFQYVPKTDYGAIFGALDFVDGSMFRGGETGARTLPMFLTTQGICVGMPDLAVNNLTRTKFTIPASGSGAALFMPGPNRFIATSNF